MLGSLTAIWISIMLLMVLIMTFAIGSVVSTLSSGSTPVKISDNSILTIELNGNIEERVVTPDIYDMINERPQPTALENILNAIKAAEDDESIIGIYLQCKGAAAGLATREAIRDALAAFKERGKWIVAYGDAYTQGDYYVASVADEIYLNPVGAVELKGLASGIPFFKGFLDKAGIEMQVIKVGTFKSAVEPYIMTGMSEANRLQTSVFLDNMWKHMADEIASSRGIKVDSLNILADSMLVMTPAENLVDLKVVDGLKYTNEMSDYLKTQSLTNAKKSIPLVSVGDYLGSGVKVPHEKSEKKKIAVYYAAGDITESEKGGIASDRVVPDIIKLAEDDDIDGLVLRVNSGGGSAFASEQIWHALEVLKSKDKPFYVSMGDYAASGGYYISCGADKIYAQPLTLTGSIGIFGMIPCVKELLNNKLGINFDFVSTNANSSGPNIMEPMTPFQRQRLQQEVDRGYELFTSRCAEGRGISQDSIKAIAEGRVWDGMTAKKIGLVDELGSLEDAIADLADENGFTKYQVISYPDAKASFWDVILEFNTQMRVNSLKKELGIWYPAYEEMKRLDRLSPVQARMETVLFE